MLRSNLAGLAALLCSTAPMIIGAAQADEGGELGMGSVQVGVHGGTLGLGVNAGIDFTDQVAGRAIFSMFRLEYEETESDNEYTGDLDLQTIGLVADWHPFDSGFRVTGGAFLNNNEISATATSEDLEIGDEVYSGRIDMLLDFETIAPYFGAGWTSGLIGEPGLSFSLDAGLLYQQAPRLSASGSIMGIGPAAGCSFSLSSGGDATVRDCDDEPTLEVDLEAEHAELSADLEDFEWYPVLAIGVSYRF